MLCTKKSAKTRFPQWMMRIVGGVAIAMAVAGYALSATTERIVTDPYSGLAIFGYDPVAYFTDGRATVGSSEHEMRYRGAIWRFANAGNREAFAADPDIYQPRFGGHGAMAVARGYPAAGNPQIWAIHGERLYLFFSAGNRFAWLPEADDYVAAASRNWSRLEVQLPR